MGRSLRLSIAAAVLGGLALTAGFFVFARSVQHMASAEIAAADGIVVLTGGEDRIEAGIRLLSEGKGRRLLISGVHPAAGAAEIKRIRGQDSALIPCCVDFGYAALDTSGNAQEARDWAERYRFGRLILVTSSYHMPRSLAEFARTLPEVEVLAYAVPTRHYHLDAWWQHRATARLLVVEYLKFLAAAVRFGLVRIFLPWERHSWPGSPGAIGRS